MAAGLRPSSALRNRTWRRALTAVPIPAHTSPGAANCLCSRILVFPFECPPYFCCRAGLPTTLKRLMSDSTALYLWSAKFANSEPKTEFQLHRCERTTLLREVARGVPATARAGVDVPPNSRRARHQRADGDGMAQGIGFATATEGKTPAKTSRMSIRAMSDRESDLAGGRLAHPLPSPERQPDALRQGKPTGMRKTGMI